MSFSSAYSGNLHLYAVDWDGLGRRETVTVNDGSGNQSVALSSDFSNGAWMTFPVNVQAGGTISITVTKNGGRNAVLSGIFLGDTGSPYAAASASGSASASVSSAPQGNWVGNYGSSGYILDAMNGTSTDLSSLLNATVTVRQGTRYVWDWCTSDVRALQSSDQSTRAAATYYDANQVSVTMSFSSAYSGNLHLYAVDWDSLGRRETVIVNDGSGNQSVALSSDFSNGAWMTFPINVRAGGTVSMTVTRNGGRNAVLSGIFLGGGGSTPAPTAGVPTGLGDCKLTSVSPGLPPLFASNSVWNQPLSSNAAIDPNSSSMVSELAQQASSEESTNVGPWINTDDYANSVYVVGPNQADVNVTLDNTTAPGAANLQAALHSVPIPIYARPSGGNDGVTTILQPSTDKLWEFWQPKHEADGWHASWGGAMQGVSASPGYFSSSSWPGASWSWGAGAASLPMIAGMISVADLKSGHIDHALSLEIPHPRAGAFALPAQRTDGDSSDLDSLPEGATLRLSPSLNIASLHLPPVAAMIARAAQTYGIVINNTSNPNIAFVAEDANETGLATQYPFPAPPGAGSAPWWGPAPYYGPNNGGLFGGLVPSQLLANFPWSSLQVLQMDLQPADANGDPVNPPGG